MSWLATVVTSSSSCGVAVSLHISDAICAALVWRAVRVGGYTPTAVARGTT
ncbi:Uncharacterised protein [Mycobacterium tuberculosis]|uniref:Uncharacterized protein n=1 Tax=Mycobacterium tuberculosis TaxID=1773 RepID=A0A916LGL3_MYCTX|nr:Uncharacterised protein [Mycobacterium tuberculosis]CPB12993.1 Uncharacterised protein [Mycobacterium tuberculosis]